MPIRWDSRLLDDSDEYALVTLAEAHPSHDEMMRLIRRAQAGDIDARKQAIRANLRLVFDVAFEFDRPDYPVADRVQDGVVGLARAIDKFDLDSRWRFSTYAHRWVWQSIQRGIARGARGVRLPDHVEAEWLRIREAMTFLHQHLQRPPTRVEVERHSGISLARIEAVVAASRYPLRLDTPLDNDEGEFHDASLVDLVRDAHAADPAAEVAADDEQARLAASLDTLEPVEVAVLCHRFGLRGHQRRDLMSTARLLGLERIQVRRIERGALQKLQELG